MTINPGDQVVWVSTTTNTPVHTGTSASPNFTTPTLAPGAHGYRVHILSADGCTGDASDEYKVYVLPSTTLALSNPSADEYCENATTRSSKIVASATAGATLPEKVTYSYTWQVEKNGASVADLSTVGNITTNINTLSSEFEVTTATVGTYAISTKVHFTVPVGSVLKSNDNQGCVETTSPKQVTVTPKPGKPTITIL